MRGRTVAVGPVEVGEGRPVALIAGPCALESEAIALEVAREVASLAERLGVPYIFKSSYLKDNRLSPGSYSGPGLEEGLRILSRVREGVGVPVLSDVHAREEVAPAAAVLDAIQIPAFLCRQTSLLEAAARTGKPINIKKGQFMAPWDMAQSVAKVRSAGNDNVLITERGASFGYNRLVTDFRAISQMQAYAPVVFDATHSVQAPAGLGDFSGGERLFAPLLARAAMAVGADALFIETHPDPAVAKCDAACQLPLAEMADVLARCKAVRDAACPGD